MTLPHATSDLPGTGGRIRARDDDFRVLEVPLYEPLGEGDHVYVRIEKRGLATFEVVRRLARELGLRDRDVGYAGMKDARAVTEQTLSVEHVPEAEIERAIEAVPSVRLVSLARHRNKLRLGHLAGNAFEIVVRDAVEGASARAEAVLARLREAGCPNWFGAQRFGERGDNHEFGRRLVRGERVAQQKPRSVRRLLVSAYQSHLFNTLLAQRIDDLGRLEDGDLAWLHDRGAVFTVDDAAAEQPRADELEISPSGPLFGTKTSLASGAPGARERALMAAEELAPADFDVRGVGTFRGVRRPYRVPVPDATVEEVDATTIRLTFTLPPGSYATALLAEITKTP